MKIPIIHRYIDRRILINLATDPGVMEKIMPSAFSPKLYEGKHFVGICLMRLNIIKPERLPYWIGVNSKKGAHRIAVE